MSLQENLGAAKLKVLVVPRETACRSWPKHDRGAPLLITTLAEALERRWHHEAYFVARAPTLPINGVQRRLTRTVLTEPGCLALIGGEIRVQLGFFDIDAPKHIVLGEDGLEQIDRRTGEPVRRKSAPHEVAEWWDMEAQEGVHAFLDAYPGSIAYRSKGGVRLLWIRATPLRITTEAEDRTFAAQIVAECAHLRRRFGLAADCLSEFERFQRVPHDQRVGDTAPADLWCSWGSVAELQPLDLALEESDHASGKHSRARARRAEEGTARNARDVTRPTALRRLLEARGLRCTSVEPGVWDIECPAAAGHTPNASGERDYASKTYLYEEADKPVGYIHCLSAGCRALHPKPSDYVAEFSRVELEQAGLVDSETGEPEPDLGDTPPPDDYEHSDDDSPSERPPVGADGKPLVLLERGDHVELAGLLIQQLRRETETVHADGSFYRYDSTAGVWRTIPYDEVGRLVNAFAGRVVVERRDRSGRLKFDLVGIYDSVVNGTRARARDELERVGFFSGAPPGIMFTNGFVTLTKRHELDVVERSPRHRARFAYDYDFDPEAEPSATLEYLQQVFDGDEDAEQKIQLLREHAGLSILGLATRFQKAIALLGAGANGKSQWLQLLPHLVPDGASSSIPPQRFAHEYYRAELAGKLINVVNEMPEAEIIGSEAFKSIITGERIEARPIRQPVFHFTPRAGHIFAANTLPASQDATDGFWRRWVVVTFNRTFKGAADKKELWKSLLEERAQITSWCVAAAAGALQRGTLTIPASSAAAQESWAASTDQVRLFLAECCEPLGCRPVRDGLTLVIAHSEYLAWAKEAAFVRPLTRPAFAARLRAAGYYPRPSTGRDYYPIVVKRRESNLFEERIGVYE